MCDMRARGHMHDAHRETKGGDTVTITFNCPYCKTRLEADDNMAGKAGLCPICEERVTAPDMKDEEEVQQEAST